MAMFIQTYTKLVNINDILIPVYECFTRETIITYRVFACIIHIVYSNPKEMKNIKLQGYLTIASAVGTKNRQATDIMYSTHQSDKVQINFLINILLDKLRHLS